MSSCVKEKKEGKSGERRRGEEKGEKEGKGKERRGDCFASLLWKMRHWLGMKDHTFNPSILRQKETGFEPAWTTE